MAFTVADTTFMQRALELAALGMDTTTPNPRVGCVLVRDGVVVGEGYHQRAGEAHAEVLALRAAGERARGSTAYVTLEPCAHHGRTPPCELALREAGVATVVAAVRDPDPRVSGQGLAALAAAGLQVREGLLAEAARELNIGFFSRQQRGRPWVRMKVAATLDGRTALDSGESRWITGEAARLDAHRYRARACAVLIGIGTLIKDDPQLTVRHIPCTRQPLRVVVDRHLQIPLAARVLEGGNLVVVSARRDAARERELQARGARVVHLPDPHGRVDLCAMMTQLGREGTNEVLTESGNRLNGALLQAGVVDEMLLYLAPALLGDGARGMFALPGPATLDQRSRWRYTQVEPVGEDLRVLARPLTQGE